MVASFILFLVLFTAIGAASVLRSRGGSDDYLLASRSVPPWLSALSSVATNNSGYMFIGLIGFAYTDGLAAMWLQLGWILGDVIAWAWFHRRVREASGAAGVATLPALMATRTGGHGAVRMVTAGIAIILMVAYASAQLSAGSKALTVLFGWEAQVGAVLGAVIVLLYSMSGGIRASIWTDATQAVVMLLAMVALVGASMVAVGGPSGLLAGLEAQDPALLSLFPEDLRFGIALWLIGFVFGGLGVMGQPHILVRTMALRSPDDIPKARRVYFAWYIPFSVCAVAVGLASRVLLPDVGTFDPELALPQMAVDLLPGLVVGGVLAGLFAATMSTADSLIIACSASLTRDLAPGLKDRPKWATLAATVVALALAIWGPASVFVLVLIAWSAMATAFGPLLVVRLAGAEVSSARALGMIFAGLGASLAWRFALGWNDALYEILPGCVAGFGVWAAGLAFDRLRAPTEPSR